MANFLGSVTIDGHPIAIDHQQQMMGFLADRMPPEQILFTRWMPTPKGHPAVLENLEEITPPYPPLPDLQIGELQWPSGYSRYARALYAVDKQTMHAIAVKAWGYAGSMAAFTDVPANWGTSWAELIVRINGEEIFECRMCALPPQRVPGAGADLWLLPLVDARFEYQHIGFELPEDWVTTPGNPASDITWVEFFTALSDQMGISIQNLPATVDSAYGVPDRLTIKEGTSCSCLLDCAALSIGMRPVVLPSEINAACTLMTPADSTATRNFLNLKKSRTAGGNSGMAAWPKDLIVWCRRAEEFSLHLNKQERRVGAVNADGSYDHLAYAAWCTDWRTTLGSLSSFNTSETGYFVGKIASDIEDWRSCGGHLAFAGAINYVPSGYDDYCTFRTQEGVFQTRVVELPAVFIPHMYLNQTPDLIVFDGTIHAKTKASCAARNETTGAMTSVSCDMYYVFTDGTVQDTTRDVTIFNPGGLIDSGKWATAEISSAGRWEFVVVKCT